MTPVGLARGKIWDSRRHGRRLQRIVHKHMRRLERVWVDQPVYFITTCTHLRKPILTSEPVAQILRKEWRDARQRHGWAIGRYVIMPEHVHFFCAPELDAKPLSIFIGFWKEWTSKGIKHLTKTPGPVWQEQFFDHVLRSSGSYAQKWDYVRDNPVRAGLVTSANDWPWQGEVEELRPAGLARGHVPGPPGSTPPATTSVRNPCWLRRIRKTKNSYVTRSTNSLANTDR